MSLIKGLHHVTSFAGDPQMNNLFFTKVMGLRRVKKTVNFDAPDVYHLYYGNEVGTPGTVMTYFPFPNIGQGRPGTGEVGATVFAVPEGSLPYWENRLQKFNVDGIAMRENFGRQVLYFSGTDGDMFALTEQSNDRREAYVKGDVKNDHAIRGFNSTVMRLRDAGPTAELLNFMGYKKMIEEEDTQRFVLPSGNGADVIDIEIMPNIGPAQAGSGTVHHIAFAVEDRAAQLKIRQALVEQGFNVTPVIDRDYFFSIYFRTPGGVLFEIATNEPGFDRDEDVAHLGEGLKLPKQHEHLRAKLEKTLLPIAD